MEPISYRPAGWPALIPRILARDPEALVTFIKHVFDASGEPRDGAPTELWIDGSVLMVSDASARSPATAFLYVYVPDADATYRRALAAGARSVEAPHDLPYGDRRAMVEDAWGNTWQIATRRAAAAGP